MPQTEKRAVFVTDYGFGDYGKGKTTAAYSRYFNAHTNFRSSSGPQAVHYLVLEDGRSHGFSQFCSGTFEGVRTHLTRFMLVSPIHLIDESRELEALGISKPFDRMTIDRRCPILTPYHRAANWLKEVARGDGAHGTCGMGIGELAQDLLHQEDDVIYADDLQNTRSLVIKTRRQRMRKREELKELLKQLEGHPNHSVEAARYILESDAMMRTFIEESKYIGRSATLDDGARLSATLKRNGTIIFEGAQGILLDENFGFHPHTTWSKTGHQYADTVLAEQQYNGDRLYLGGFRTYSTRHGAGPFPANDPSLKPLFPEHHNSEQNWQGAFRVGWFDLVMARYAIRVGGRLDGLAITHVDTITKNARVNICIAYRYNGAITTELHEMFDIINLNGTPAIININPSNPGDLERQECIGRHLTKCTPILEALASDRILVFLEAALEHPILMSSHGPRATDTVFHQTSTYAQSA